MLMIKGSARYFYNIIFIIFPFFHFVKYHFSSEHIFNLRYTLALLYTVMCTGTYSLSSL